MVVMAPDSERATAQEQARHTPGLPAHEPDRRRFHRFMAFLSLATSALFSLVFILRTAFTVGSEWYFTLFDDAMVSMRYARNLAAGYGLVWNPGEPPIEGYTNFLWTLWMAGLHLLPIPTSKISLLVMLSGAIILVGNVGVVGAIASRVAPEGSRVVPLAMWATALYYPLNYWTLRGMEVGFVALLIAGGILLALRLQASFRQRDLVLLAALMAAGILTRTDAIIPCVSIAAYVVLMVPTASRRRAAIVLGGTLLGTLILHTTGRLLYYGHPFPNTYYLKVQGIDLTTRLHRGVWWLVQVGLVHLFAPLVFAVTAFALRRRSISSGAWLLASVFLGQCAYSAYVGGDAWEWMLFANRHLTPAVPGLLILAALGIDALLDAPAANRRLAATVLAVSCAPLLVIGITGWLLTTDLGIWISTPQRLISVPGMVLPGRISVMGILLLCIGLLAIAPFLHRAGEGLPRLGLTQVGPTTAICVFLAMALLTAVNGEATGYWVARNAVYADADAKMTQCGLALRDATESTASIAVVWAGAPSYFSERPAIDLLGKSDYTIATSAPKRVDTLLGNIDGFVPGHNKWDYDYSIGRLRPDVVAQLWQSRDPGIPGYVPVGEGVFARSGSTQIALERLSSANLSNCRGY